MLLCSSSIHRQVERVGIGSTFVKQAQDARPHDGGNEPTAVSRIEIVPSRREVKRTAAAVAMPPPPPTAKAAPPPPPSASGYQAPPWASSPPAGALARTIGHQVTHRAIGSSKCGQLCLDDSKGLHYVRAELREPYSSGGACFPVATEVVWGDTQAVNKSKCGMRVTAAGAGAQARRWWRSRTAW